MEALVDGAGKRARAFRLLLARRADWGFALVVFSELHSAGHLLWHGVDRGGHPLGVLETSAEAGRRYERVVRAVDAAVGEVLAGQQNDVQIVLFSVHGTAPNANDLPANYLVPELLQRVDFAWPRRSNPRPAVPRLVVPDANCSIGTVLSGGLRGPDRLRGPGPPSALGVLSARLRRRIRRLKAPADAWQSWPSAPGEGEARPSDQGESLAYLGACDYQDLWPWSRAFVLPSFSDAQVRVNLAGRESAGVVSSRDYVSELQRVETLLRLARDPSTGRVLDVEFERPRIGDHLARGGPPADLLARYADPVDCWDHPLAGKIGPYPYLRSGEHGGAGFLAVVGDNEPVNDLAVAELGPFLGRFFQPR